MRVLVTGAAGFVGLNVIRELASFRDEVLGLSRHLPETDSHAFPENVRFERCDVRNNEEITSWIATWQPTHIVHAAAITPTSIFERMHARAVLETNQLSLLTILEAAIRTDVTRVLFLSSAGVYASPRDATPMPETSPLRHDGSLYGLTKIAGEGLCRWARRQHGFDARSVRVGPVYGPFERPTGSRENMSQVWSAVQLLLNREPIRCNNPAAIYDWIHGKDCAQAIRLLLTADQLSFDAYNLAGPAVTMEELLDSLAKILPESIIDWTGVREPNLKIPDSYRCAPLDIHALTKDIDFQPRFDLGDGLQDYVDWLRNHSY